MYKFSRHEKLPGLRARMRPKWHGGDIDRGATFTKGECLSTLSSPSSAFASRGEKREGGKVERKRHGEKERKVRHVLLRSRNHSHDNGAPMEPVALYCFAGS